MNRLFRGMPIAGKAERERDQGGGLALVELDQGCDLSAADALDQFRKTLQVVGHPKRPEPIANHVPTEGWGVTVRVETCRAGRVG